MSRAQHDYALLEREYIQSDISIRELAERHQIKAWSAVNVQKNKREWDRKRAEYQERLAASEVDTLVMARLRTVSEIHNELLLAIRHAVRRFIADVSAENDAQSVSARDLMGLIDKFLLLIGQPTSRSENKNLDFHDFGGLLRGAPEPLLAELAELARQNGAGGRAVGRGPLVILEGTGVSKVS